MKKILLITFCLPLLSIAQTKQDNVIIANGATFKQVVNILLDNGYIIEKLDSNYNTIKTEYKKIAPNSWIEIMLNIRVKDSSVIIKGIWKNDTMHKILSETINGHGDGAGDKDPGSEVQRKDKSLFKEMDRIAKLFSTEVTYAKQ